MEQGATKAVQLYHEFQTTFAVVFGMFVQFLFGDTKTLKVGWLITVSSVFMAVYIMPFVIELLNLIPNLYIAPDSKIAIGMYALSALLSMELLALIITILPSAIGIKIKKLLGVCNANK